MFSYIRNRWQAMRMRDRLDQIEQNLNFHADAIYNHRCIVRSLEAEKALLKHSLSVLS